MSLITNTQKRWEGCPWGGEKGELEGTHSAESDLLSDMEPGHQDSTNSSDSSWRLFPHLYNRDKENIELIGLTRGFSEYVRISVKCTIAPHVRGSCCFRQKHSRRDESNVSAPQSLEDRSFITPNSLALALYLLHSPALLCSATRFCKQT